MRDLSVWLRSLLFLFERTLREIDMGPMRMTADAPEIAIAQDPRFTKTRVTITFWAEPR